jgi:hypothetical protein
MVARQSMSALPRKTIIALGAKSGKSVTPLDRRQLIQIKLFEVPVDL